MQINGIHWNGTERNGKEWNAMHVCMYACMHVCMYACTYMYNILYILFAYACIHTEAFPKNV